MNHQQNPAEQLSTITIGNLLIKSHYKQISLTMTHDGSPNITYKEIAGIKDYFNISGREIAPIINSLTGYETVELKIISEHRIELKELFKNNSDIKTLKLDTKKCKVVDMWWCFENCTNLETLDLSKVSYKSLIDNENHYFIASCPDGYVLQHKYDCDIIPQRTEHTSIYKIAFDTLPKLKEIKLNEWLKEDVKAFLDNDIKDNQLIRLLVENIHNKMLLYEFTSKIEDQERKLQELKIEMEDMKTSLQNECKKQKQELMKKHGDELKRIKQNFQNETNSMKQEIEEQTKQKYINEIEKLKAQLVGVKRFGSRSAEGR